MYKIGIIGTANRNNRNITADYYDLMKSTVQSILTTYIAQTSEPIMLVSGGAAVADHIAVKLFINNTKQYRLYLHLPAEFDFDNDEYKEPESCLSLRSCGDISNYYHNQFERMTKINTLADFDIAKTFNADFEVTPGFKQRNTKVATDAQIMIALTYGDKARIADGGTKDTMVKFLAKGIGQSYHINLTENCKVYTPAII